MLPNTIEKAIGQPPISSLVKSVGLDVLKLQVEYELTVLSALVSVGGNLTNFSIPFIADQLILQFPNESLADFKLCFQRGAMGAYGNIQRLDGVTIGVWFKEYLEEKYQAIEAKLMSEKDEPYKIMGTPENLLIKQKQEPGALPIEQAGSYLDQWMKNIEASKIEISETIQKPKSIIPKGTSYIADQERYIMKQRIDKVAAEVYKGLYSFTGFSHYEVNGYKIFAKSYEEALRIFAEANGNV